MSARLRFRGSALVRSEPFLSRAEGRALAAMAHVAEEGACFGTPTFGRLAIAHAHEEAMRAGGFLVDAANTRGQGASGCLWHEAVRQMVMETLLHACR